MYYDAGILQVRVKGGLPTISDYADAVSNARGRFRTLGEVEALTDARDEVVFFAGNNAAVFPVVARGRHMTLKCYIKSGLYTDDVYGYLTGHDDELLAPVRLLKDEIYVYDIYGGGAYYDIVVAEWTEGVTLETAMKRASRNDGFTFGALSEAFDEAARRLLEREWAHGDLKPENIIVQPGGTMRLIDYDAMFVPSLSGRPAFEIGTPPYQHPARDERMFDKSLDDYPVALISVCLRALSLEPQLYKRHHRSDNIILYSSEILGGGSAAYDEILRLFAAQGEHDSYRLALSLRTVQPQIGNLTELLRGSRVVYPVAPPAMPRVADVTAKCETRLEPFRSGSLWGYRRAAGGKEVIPAIYETAHEFSEGLAVVCIHGLWQVIAPDGAVAIDCSAWREVKPFSHGLAPVCDADGAWSYITRDGVVAFEPRFEMAGMFREGLALVMSNGKYGYVSPQGEFVIEPAYDYATGFRDGRATVQQDGETFEILNTITTTT